MTIEPTNPEILGSEPYQPTSNPQVFIHAQDGSVLILKSDSAFKITP